jgi:peroxiredoxin family protein
VSGATPVYNIPIYVFSIIGKKTKEKNKMTDEATNLASELTEQEKIEMIILAICIIGSLVLGYRNKDRIKQWFNDIIK